MNRAILINLLFIAYCIGLVVALASVNTDLKNIVEGRDISPTIKTLKVREPVNYEDNLQQSASNRAIRLQGSYQ